MYNLLTKRVKTYCDVEFHKYEITHSNTDISNEFQYTKFDKYKESETVEIDISKLTDQNTSIEFSIKSSAEAQDINSFNAFHDVLSEIINTSITLYCSEHNQQSTYY